MAIATTPLLGDSIQGSGNRITPRFKSGKRGTPSPQMDGLPKKPTLPCEAPPWPFQQFEDETTRMETANYYNCVRRLDAGVGLLIEKP
jgi:arylsulfatase A-like enzyme